MNPNYYRSISPQPPSASSRDHQIRTMYQQYGATPDMMRLHPMGAAPYGFIHQHPGTGQFYAAAPGFHMAQMGELPTHRASGIPMESPRPAGAQSDLHGSSSPHRRRPTMLADYSERERYMRTVSPTENLPPTGSHLPRPSHQRPHSPSPKGQMHHNSGGMAGYSAQNRTDYRENHERVTNPKKAKLTEGLQREIQESFVRGGAAPIVVKHEMRNQDYLARPIPFEAISPPSTEENSEVDRMCQQVEAEIRTLETNMKACEKNIDQWEAELKTAEARKEEYEKAKKSHAELERPSTPETGVTGDLARRIVSENRRVADSEHQAAKRKFGILLPSPVLYPQPSNLAEMTIVFNEYQKERPGIILRLKKDRQAKQIRERYLKERYKQLSQAYLSRLEKVESNPKKRNREAKMREYYERQFPEIKKMREDKIRDSRLTRTTKNDLESDPSGTEDTQLELDKYQRNAVMVPMLLDAKDRSRHFHDRNRLVENCARDYKESVSNSFWTQEEKDIFKEKYLQRPKDFGFISSFLKRKSVQECVQYYYLTKRKENYKQMVKKQKAFRIRRGPNKRLQSADEPVSPNKMGVSTLTLTNSLVGSSLRFSSVTDVRTADGEEVKAITLTIVCPARKCQAGRRSIKRLFKTPSEFPNYTNSCVHLELPETATSCCKYCVYYIEKRLGLKKWSTTEVEVLKKALVTHGPNWNLIAKSILTKRLRDCVQYYRQHAAELASLADIAQLSVPSMLDDDYSPWSASSSSDDEPVVSEKTLAGIPAENQEPVRAARAHSDDSNATLSAEEVDDDPEPRPQFLTTLSHTSIANSISPAHLPPLETRPSPSTSSYAPTSAEYRPVINGPACVRDLIHSAIEKNLDKDRNVLNNVNLPEDFRRRLEQTASNIIMPKDRFADRRGEVDVSALARTMEDPMQRLLPPRSAHPNNSRSPSRSDIGPAVSPGRRDFSPSAEDNKRTGGGSSQNSQHQQQTYQYSTRQNLLTDFATSRQLHAEQSGQGHSGDRMQGSGQQGGYENQHGHSQPDPRYMQTFFSPYVAYLPPGIPYTSILTPEYMEQLAAAGFPPMGLGAAGVGVPSMMPQRTMAAPQRSIMLGTGRPGTVDDSSGSAPDRESASRLQTLAANRGLLRDSGSNNPDKRKPEVITLDESRRDGSSPSASADMRFHPAPHHMKTEHQEKEPNPNLTAGSLIDVIITRQISNARGGEQASAPAPTGSVQQRAPLKREEAPLPSMSSHKPFTLGEHIEQIIANDFSRKDNMPNRSPRQMGVASPLNSLCANPMAVASPLANLSGGTMGMQGIPVSLFQQYPLSQGGQMGSNDWKKRLRMDEPPQGPSYQKSCSSLAATVEYEPISPPEKEPSDSDDDIAGKGSGEK